MVIKTQGFQGYTGVWRTIVIKGDYSVLQTIGMWMRPNNNRIFYNIKNNLNNNENGETTTEIPVEEWTHVTFVKNNGSISFYLNGSLDSTKTLVGQTVGNECPIYLGKSPWFAGTDCRMDDFKIFMRPLNISEVLGISSLVDYLRFDEVAGLTATDSSGYANNGTLQGMNEYDWSQGKVAGALDFDGDDCVMIPDSDQIESIGTDNGNFSMAFWFRLEAGHTGSLRSIASKADAGEQRGISLFMNSSDDKLLYGVRNSAGNFEEGTSVSEIPLDTWKHISYVKNRNILYLYLDGVLDSTKDLDGDTDKIEEPVYLGKTPWYAGTDCKMDDFKILLRAMSDQEIREISSVVMHLRLDETSGAMASDSSGYPQFGMLNNMVNSNWTTGKIAGALLFDGSDDFLSIANSPQLEAIGANNSDFSAAFWLYLDAEQTGYIRSILHKGNNDGERVLAMWMNSTDNKLLYGITNSSNTDENGQSSSQIPLEEWTHVAYVKNGSTLSLYLNGVLDSSISLAGQTAGNNGPLYLGDSPWHNPTACKIDDFKIFSRPISLAEILDLSSLVMHLKLDERCGPSASDSSGNANIGILNYMDASDWIDGKVAGALDFDGSNDYVPVAASASLRAIGADNGNYSMSFWFYLAQGHTGSWRAFVNKGVSHEQRLISLWMSPDDDKLYYSVRNSSDTYFGEYSTVQIPVGKWMHVALVRDGGMLSLYLDGALDSTKSFSGETAGNTGSLYLGKIPNYNATSARMDDIRIYSQAMTPSEVQELSETGTPQFTVSFVAGANGSLSGNSPQYVLEGGSCSAVTALPATGYHLVNWTGTAGFINTTSNPLTVANVASSMEITANFAINTYTVTFTAGSNGSISGTSPQTVEHGTDCTAVTAIPSEGYHFTGWTGAYSGSENPITFASVASDMELTANFAIDTHTVTFTSGGNGSLTGDSSQVVEHNGDCTPVTAVPDAGYCFVNWTGEFTRIANPIIISTVTSDISVTANFLLGTLDSDADGMMDWWEIQNGLNPADASDAALDSDADGLSNLAEFQNGTDPENADSDTDGLSDGSEVLTYLTNPNSADSDGDGRSDYDEVCSGSDPNVLEVSIIVNDNKMFTKSRGIPIDPLVFVGTQYAEILVADNPAMDNPQTITSPGEPFDWYLPDDEEKTYTLYFQYADSSDNPQGDPMMKQITLDTTVPVLTIASPVQDETTDQAYVVLDLTAYDPNPQDPNAEFSGRDVKVYVNDELQDKLLEDRLLIERFPVAGTDANSVTICVEDEAGNETEQTVGWTVNTSTDGDYPTLSNINIIEDTINSAGTGATTLPDVPELWVQGMLDDPMADVRYSVNEGDFVPFNIIRNNAGNYQFGGLVPLEPGINKLAIQAYDLAGHMTEYIYQENILNPENSNPLIRSDYTVGITSHTPDDFANGAAQDISGIISKVINGENVSTVSVNGVAVAPEDLIDNLDGTLTFTANAVPSATDGSMTPINVTATTVAGEDSKTYTSCATRIEGYEILYRNVRRHWSQKWHCVVNSNRNPDRWWTSIFMLFGDIDIYKPSYTNNSTQNIRYFAPNTGLYGTRVDNPDITSYPSLGGYWEESGDGNYTIPSGGSSAIVSELVENKGNAYLFQAGMWRDYSEFHPGESENQLPDIDILYQKYSTVMEVKKSLGNGKLGEKVTVLLSFEGIAYERFDNDPPLDLNLVKYKGQKPVSIDPATSTAAYLVELKRGIGFTIADSDFDWPKSQRSSVIGDPAVNGVTSTNTLKSRFSFEWFHNQEVIADLKILHFGKTIDSWYLSDDFQEAVTGDEITIGNSFPNIKTPPEGTYYNWILNNTNFQAESPIRCRFLITNEDSSKNRIVNLQIMKNSTNNIIKSDTATIELNEVFSTNFWDNNPGGHQFQPSVGASVLAGDKYKYIVDSVTADDSRLYDQMCFHNIYLYNGHAASGTAAIRDWRKKRLTPEGSERTYKFVMNLACNVHDISWKDAFAAETYIGFQHSVYAFHAIDYDTRFWNAVSTIPNCTAQQANDAAKDPPEWIVNEYLSKQEIPAIPVLLGNGNMIIQRF